MPGPLSVVQRLLNISRLVKQDPLTAYRLACRYCWFKEASFASSKSLSSNLSDHMNASSLRGIGSEDLLRLLHLRRAREQSLRSSLYTEHLGEPRRCEDCSGGEDMGLWESLKDVLTAFTMKDPLGNFISNNEFLQWSSCARFFEQKCECGDLYYADSMWLINTLYGTFRKLSKCMDKVTPIHEFVIVKH
jgi:hypothetical protein